jgi:hypothetical protein
MMHSRRQLIPRKMRLFMKMAVNYGYEVYDATETFGSASIGPKNHRMVIFWHGDVIRIDYWNDQAYTADLSLFQAHSIIMSGAIPKLKRS